MIVLDRKSAGSAAPGRNPALAVGGAVGSGPAERGAVGAGPAERGAGGAAPAERGAVGSGPAERGAVGSGLAECGPGSGTSRMSHAWAAAVAPSMLAWNCAPT